MREPSSTSPPRPSTASSPAGATEPGDRSVRPATTEPGRIPVVVCVDVEPDARTFDLRTPPPWRGLLRTHEILQRFRDRLGRTSGNDVRVNWYLRMDPQVQAAYGSPSFIVESHRPLFDRLRRGGDEVGLHVHAWRWDASGRTWVADYGSPAWIDECLGMAFDAFRRSIGRPCTSFRFGDRWMDQRTFHRLEDLGVEIDLTLEPGFDQASFYTPSDLVIGALPDHRAVPATPYRPSPTDYRVRDRTRQNGIWELPVTTGRAWPGLLHRLYSRWVTGRPPTDVSSALLSLAPSVFRRVIETALGRQRPHLVLPLHAGAARVPRYARRIRANLASLAERPDARRLAWVTPAEAIRRLTG